MLYVRALHFAIGVFLLNQVVSVIPRLQATSAQVISSHLYYGRVSHISGELFSREPTKFTGTVNVYAVILKARSLSMKSMFEMVETSA